MSELSEVLAIGKELVEKLIVLELGTQGGRANAAFVVLLLLVLSTKQFFVTIANLVTRAVVAILAPHALKHFHSVPTTHAMWKDALIFVLLFLGSVMTTQLILGGSLMPPSASHRLSSPNIHKASDVAPYSH